jgi:hypothetical protein
MTTASNAQLRVVLECLTSSTPAVEQPQLIAKLPPAFPHSIIPAPPLLAPVHPIASYNCFMFAFGLAGREEVHLIRVPFSSTYCNGEFAAYLAELTLVPVASPADNDLVLYHDGQQYAHAGLVYGDRVLSKWGTGLLWLHGTHEVPTSCGSTISYYRAVNPEEALAAFLAFARQREGAELVNEVLGSLPKADA